MSKSEQIEIVLVSLEDCEEWFVKHRGCDHAPEDAKLKAQRFIEDMKKNK